MSKIIKKTIIIALYTVFCIALCVAFIITCVKRINSNDFKSIGQIVTLKNEGNQIDSVLVRGFSNGKICDGFSAKGQANVPEREYIIPSGANLLIKRGEAILKGVPLYEFGGQSFNAEFSGILFDITNQADSVLLKFYDYDNASTVLSVPMVEYLNYYNCAEDKKFFEIVTSKSKVEIINSQFSTVSNSYLLQVRLIDPSFEFINGSIINFNFRYNVVSADYIVVADSIKIENGKNYLNLYNVDTKTIQKCEIVVLYTNGISSSISFVDKPEGRFNYMVADTIEEFGKISFLNYDVYSEFVKECI